LHNARAITASRYSEISSLENVARVTFYARPPPPHPLTLVTLYTGKFPTFPAANCLPANERRGTNAVRYTLKRGHISAHAGHRGLFLPPMYSRLIDRLCLLYGICRILSIKGIVLREEYFFEGAKNLNITFCIIADRFQPFRGEN
jgi:hypothetical protein